MLIRELVNAGMHAESEVEPYTLQLDKFAE
jgi:hypothetical protein